MARSAEADGRRPDGSGYRLATRAAADRARARGGSRCNTLRSAPAPLARRHAVRLAATRLRSHRSDQRARRGLRAGRLARATTPSGPSRPTTRPASASRSAARTPRSAKVSQAVAASCAIPAFYHPVSVDGRRYIDGGICSPSNLDLLCGEELDLVVCLNPMSSLAQISGGSPGDRVGGAASDLRRPPARPRGAQAARRRHEAPDAPAGRRRREGHGLQHDVRQPPLHRDVHRDEEHRPGASQAAAARQLGPAGALPLALRGAAPPGGWREAQAPRGLTAVQAPPYHCHLTGGVSQRLHARSPKP